MAGLSPARTLDQAALQELDASMRGGAFGPVNALLIQQSGALLYEGYYRGTDREGMQLLNSVTKSIGATLSGIAERRGLLDTTQTMQQLLPQYAWTTPELAPQATLKFEHVLQMRHGLEWDEWTHGFTDPRNSAVMMFASDDWYRYTLGRPQREAPGTRFRYSTGNSTLMSAVLSRLGGAPPQDLFAEWLAAPLGIARFHWELWSPDGPGSGLREFPFDEAPLGVGLWLRPVDLLKIGQLYLDRGLAPDGTRLIDEDWIERSWTRYSRNDNDPEFASASEPAGYGYQWWFRELLAADGRRHACWYANGAGRQYLIVCPADELVVVSTGESYSTTGPGVFTLLREQVLPKLDHPITGSLSGFYYDPASDGQGVSIEVVEAAGQVALAWYTFEDGQQRWYAMAGPIEGNSVVFNEVIYQQGGEFLSPNSGRTVHAGSARLRWLSCDRAELAFDLQAGTRQGVYALRRIAGCPASQP